MGTKSSPSSFDCYANAEPDEPLFTLLARDPLAEYLVSAWAALRAYDVETAHRLMNEAVKDLAESGKQYRSPLDPKLIEANDCAQSMRHWRLDRKLGRIEERLSAEKLQVKETT